jgi:hypothetical protein
MKLSKQHSMYESEHTLFIKALKKRIQALKKASRKAAPCCGIVLRLAGRTATPAGIGRQATSLRLPEQGLRRARGGKDVARRYG